MLLPKETSTRLLLLLEGEHEEGGRDPGATGGDLRSGGEKDVAALRNVLRFEVQCQQGENYDFVPEL